MTLELIELIVALVVISLMLLFYNVTKKDSKHKEAVARRKEHNKWAAMLREINYEPHAPVGVNRD